MVLFLKLCSPLNNLFITANFLFLSKDKIGSSNIIKSAGLLTASYINNINANSFFSP